VQLWLVCCLVARVAEGHVVQTALRGSTWPCLGISGVRGVAVGREVAGVAERVRRPQRAAPARPARRQARKPHATRSRTREG
jgi:hypothetical protein